MSITLLYAVAGIVLGLSAAFYIVTRQLKKSNEMGNSKGDRFTYSGSFEILNAKDNVRPDLDIEHM